MKKATVQQKIYYNAKQARQLGLGFFPVNREGSVEIELTEAEKGKEPAITIEGLPDDQKYGVACLVYDRLANKGMDIRVSFNPVDLPKTSSMYSDALAEAIQLCRSHEKR